MIKNPTHYELDATQFDQALAIVRKEQQANMPSRWQRICYVLLRICVYGFVASFVIVTIVSFMNIFLPTLRERRTWVYVGSFLKILISMLFFLTLIILPLNVLLLRKLRHQIRLVRKLGLSQFFKAAWRAERRKQRFRNILVLLIVSLGLFFILIGFVSVVFITYIMGLEAWLVVSIILLFYIIIFLALIFFHLIRRYKQRLEVVARLQSSLAGYKDAAEQAEGKRIDIPSEEYEQIARIERSQILFERENILASFKEADVSYYSVQKSRSLREALDQLDPATRLAVEDQIDELAIEPQLADVTSDPATNTCRLRVPETRVEISFTVDDDNRRVRILFLKHVAADATSSSDSGGQ